MTGTEDVVSHDVFVSYAHEDAELVAALVARFRSHSLVCWHDVSSMPLGGRLTSEIRSAIARSWYFVVVLSRFSAGSAWVVKETAAALESQLEGGSPRPIVVVADDPAAVVAEEFGHELSTMLEDLLRFELDGARSVDENLDRLWLELTRTLRLDAAARVDEQRPRLRTGLVDLWTHGYVLPATGHEPAWAADGDAVVHVRGTELLSTRRRGLVTDVVAELGPIRAAPPAWTGPGPARPARLRAPAVAGDGSAIAVWDLPATDEHATTTADLVIIRAADGSERARVRSRLRAATGYVDVGFRAWHPDRPLLAHVTSDDRLALVNVDADGTEIRHAASEAAGAELGPVTSVDWSPDGRHLVVVRGGGGEVTLTTLDRDLATVAGPRHLKGSVVRWLGADELVMIHGGAGEYELATVDPLTMRRRRILSRAGTYRYYAAAPSDGAHDLVVHRLGDDLRVAVATWRHGEPVGPSQPSPFPPAWSRDGARLAVDADDQLLVVEVPF